MNTIISLAAKTRKGKNHLQNHGIDWKLIDSREKVSFTLKNGIWFLLESLEDRRYIMWVHINDDEDYTVVNRREEKT